jgi:hypothetical protein
MKLNAGGMGRRRVAVFQPMSIQLCTRSPNKLWISNSILNLCVKCTALCGRRGRSYRNLILNNGLAFI